MFRKISSKKKRDFLINSPFPIDVSFENWNPYLDGIRNVNFCYKRLNTISEGVYGIVHRCMCKETGIIVALKKIKLYKTTSGFPLSSLREIVIL